MAKSKNNSFEDKEMSLKSTNKPSDVKTNIRKEKKYKELNGVSIEGLIVKIQDVAEQNTGSYSIAQQVIFSNEQTLVPVQKFVPAQKNMDDLKNYYEVNGKTYKMIKNEFAQSPCFATLKDHQYIVTPVTYTEATPYTIKSVNTDYTIFQGVTDGSLRFKFEGALTSDCYVEKFQDDPYLLYNILKSERYRSANIFVYQKKWNISAVQNANSADDFATKVLENSVKFYSADVDEKDHKFKGIKENKYVEQELKYKYILCQEEDGTWSMIPNNVHYFEVNKMNFSNCSSMDDVLNILNDGSYKELVFSYADGKLVVKTKAVGAIYSITPQAALNVGTGTDLKDLLFVDAKPATATTGVVTVANFSAVNNGELTLDINGTEFTKSSLDFTSVTTESQVVDVLTGAGFTGVTFTLTSDNKVKITTTLTGSDASVKMVVATAPTGTDLTGATLLDKASEVRIAGSDSWEVGTIAGTDGAGDNIVDKYNELEETEIGFFGDVLSTTMEMSINELFALNTSLASQTNLNKIRLIMCHSLPSVYMTEATSHGALLDWLRTDLMGLVTSNTTGITNLETRGAFLSMGDGTNVLDTNAANGAKNSIHMKGITIPTLKLSDTVNKTEATLASESGCAVVAYFKQGIGLKLTIPSADNCYTWADAVNMQNIVKTFAMDLANELILRKSVNKTNADIKSLHEVLYNRCLTLKTNNVLTNDIADDVITRTIPVETATAKKYIQGTDYCTFIYTPDASTITGKIIPITCYFGFGTSVYGFTLSNVYVK